MSQVRPCTKHSSPAGLQQRGDARRVSPRLIPRPLPAGQVHLRPHRLRLLSRPASLRAHHPRDNTDSCVHHVLLHLCPASSFGVVRRARAHTGAPLPLLARASTEISRPHESHPTSSQRTMTILLLFNYVVSTAWIALFGSTGTERETKGVFLDFVGQGQSNPLCTPCTTSLRSLTIRSSLANAPPSDPNLSPPSSPPLSPPSHPPITLPSRRIREHTLRLLYSRSHTHTHPKLTTTNTDAADNQHRPSHSSHSICAVAPGSCPASAPLASSRRRR